MSIKELFKIANYYEEKYLTKNSGSIHVDNEAPFRSLLDDFGIKIVNSFTEQELQLFNPENVGKSWERYYDYFPENAIRKYPKKRLSQLKVITWLDELKNNVKFKNKELLNNINLDSLKEKIFNLNDENLFKDFYSKIAQLDELEPSRSEIPNDTQILLNFIDSGYSLEYIKNTDEYKNLEELDRKIIDKLFKANRKSLPRARGYYFGDE